MCGLVDARHAGIVANANHPYLPAKPGRWPLRPDKKDRAHEAPRIILYVVQCVSLYRRGLVERYAARAGAAPLPKRARVVRRHTLAVHSVADRLAAWQSVTVETRQTNA